MIATAEQQHLRAGVTAVRDLGDHRWAVLDRIGADGLGVGPADAGPTVVGSGPPITSPGGHCWSMGGEASGEDELRRAVRERAERGAAVVKIMASGGVMTPGTDMLACQFTLARAARRWWRRRTGSACPSPRTPTPCPPWSERRGRGRRDRALQLPTADRVPQPAGAAGPARRRRHATSVRPSAGCPGVDPPPRVQAALEAVARRPTSSTCRTSPSCTAPAWSCWPARMRASAPASGTGWCPWRSPSSCGVRDDARRGTRVGDRRSRPAPAVSRGAPGGWRPAWTPTC